MRDWLALPKKWRHLVFVMKDMEKKVPCRLMHKVERLNRRLVILEAKRRPV